MIVKLVVTVADLGSGLQPGDIILSKNGVDSLVEIERIKSEIPGSPQLKSYMASKFFRFVDSANLQIERDGELLDISINGVPYSHRDEFNRMEAFKEIEEGVYYIDLTKDTINIFKENVETLSKAKGIIFDMRGYPYTSGVWSDVIGHLIEKPIKGPVFRINQSIYPNRESVTYYQLRNEILPMKPLITGKVVYLSYAGSISQPEYILGHIKDNQVAEIVGQPTAGADGNIQKFSIPGNFIERYTAAIVLNADRSQTHLIGIQPTVPIERTIEAVKRGEDEYITKALEIINK